MTQEDATKYLINWLRQPQRTAYANYGYDVYLPNIMRAFIEMHYQLDSYEARRYLEELSPHFYSAAWELCRRGILRPGVAVHGAQATPDGSAGNGYSVTPFGREWVSESGQDDFVPTEPERFAQLLKPFQSRFGSGFYERAQQAIRCYGAHAYLATCVMCGAAAESILLAIAIAKSDEETVLKIYKGASGRSRVEKNIVGQARQNIQRDFAGHTTLLNYWRDEAAHGQASNIGDNEAFTALALLLRFSQWTDDNWDELTS